MSWEVVMGVSSRKILMIATIALGCRRGGELTHPYE
jgi:hypothetical protein